MTIVIRLRSIHEICMGYKMLKHINCLLSTREMDWQKEIAVSEMFDLTLLILIR